MTRFVLVACLIALAGCDRYEEGPVQTEDAVVVDLPYVPSGHGSGVGVGLTTSGSMAVSSISTDIPARYATVFQCQHGRFVVEGHEAMWKRLKVGQKVTVYYTEQWRSQGKTHEKYDFRLNFKDAR